MTNQIGEGDIFYQMIAPNRKIISEQECYLCINKEAKTMNYTLDGWKQKRNFESTWLWFMLSTLISFLYSCIGANAVMFYNSIITVLPSLC